jgi:hypothetical protein
MMHHWIGGYQDRKLPVLDLCVRAQRPYGYFGDK